MPNPRGNQGYGKMELVRQNVDKFSPKFWELMEIYANSRNPDFEKIFITEFNKLQVKMIPQVVAGDKDKPIPIMNIPYVQSNDSHDKDSENEPENQSSTRGNISEQDNINSALLDSVIPVGQDTEAE